MGHAENLSTPSPRPPTAELLAELMDGADDRLTEEDMRNIGIDTLHFIYSVLRAGGQIYAKLPDRRDPVPVNIAIPGLVGEV